MAATSRFQTPFVAQLLLRLFKDAVVDDAVESEFLIDQSGADVFVEHDLDAVLGDREVGGVARTEEIVGAAGDIRISCESGGKAGLDRFFFVVFRYLHSQDHGFQKALGRVRVFLEHFTTGDEDALRDSQCLVHIDDHWETFIEQSDCILGGERRGGDNASLKRDGTQCGSADGPERDVFIGIEVVSLEEDSDGKIGERAGAGDTDDLAAQLFDGFGFLAAEERVIRVIG